MPILIVANSYSHLNCMHPAPCELGAHFLSLFIFSYKPAVPTYFLTSFQPDLQTALAHFRSSACTLHVVRGRYAGEGFFHCPCRVTEADSVSLSKTNTTLSLHISTLQCVDSEHTMNIYLVNEAVEQLHLLLNQQDVVEVAKFVHKLGKQLQTLVDYLMEAHTNNLPTSRFFPAS